MHRHTIGPLTTAQRRVAVERTELQYELEAFETFADRVAAIGVQPVAGRPTAVYRSVSPRRTRSALEHLRTAYRESVMAVPHYEEFYDESLRVHIAGELSPDIAASIEGADSLSVSLKRAVLERTARAVDYRCKLLDHLRTEADSLVAATSSLSSIAAQMDGLVDATTASEACVQTLERRLQTVVDERQALIHDRRSTFIDTGTDLCTYLYGESGGWRYPVLSVAASLQLDLDALDARLGANGTAVG